MQKSPVNFSLLLTLILLSTLPHIVAEIYVPSMPAITDALASSPTVIQFTLTAFMIGFSLSQLFYGPLSDRIGRCKPIFWGIGLTMLGSLLCVIANSASVLIVGRIIQGLGVGACNSVPRSLSRDLLDGGELAKISSQMGMITVLIIAASPALGGYISHYLGWRMVFVSLLGYLLLIECWVYYILPETNLCLDPNAIKVSVIIKNFIILLKNKTFLSFAICASCAYAGVMAFLTSAPFLFQIELGLTPVEYGWLTFFIAIPIFFTSLINSYLILKTDLVKMILLGVYIMLSGGILMLFLALLGYLNTWVIMLPVSLFSLGVGFTFSNAFAGAMQPFPQMAGSAGALFGALQIFGGSIVSGLMAILPENDQIPLAIVYIFLGLICLASIKVLARPMLIEPGSK